MTPTRIPSKGDRVRVIHTVAPWYFVGELGVVVHRPHEAEYCELRLGTSQFPLVAHTSHLEVVSQ